MTITFEQLYEIDEILNHKGWDSKFNRNGDDLKSQAFKLLDYAIDEDKYVLLRHLISNYFLCTDYDRHCFDIARNIEAVFANEKVIIIPVADEMNKIKSGHAIGYDLTRFLDMGCFEEGHVLESLDSMKLRISEFHIIVIDDFIGSGTQFRAFVRRCTERYKISTDRIYLYSIVMMKKARARVSDFCYAARASHEFDRSLSDPSPLHDLIDPINVYRSIEALVSVGKNYKRGFLKSESIVTMKKTPNNTLPIFWCREKSGGGHWPAIFPRN